MKKEEIKLIIFAHGNFSNELLSVAKLVIGDSTVESSGIISLTNSGHSLVDSVSEIRNIINPVLEKNSDSKFIIITDFPGGSCFIASKKICSEFIGQVLTISGLNISMILSFITKLKDQYKDLSQFTELLKQDGIRAIKF